MAEWSKAQVMMETRRSWVRTLAMHLIFFLPFFCLARTIKPRRSSHFALLKRTSPKFIGTNELNIVQPKTSNPYWVSKTFLT